MQSGKEWQCEHDDHYIFVNIKGNDENTSLVHYISVKIPKLTYRKTNYTNIN